MCQNVLFKERKKAEESDLKCLLKGNRKIPKKNVFMFKGSTRKKGRTDTETLKKSLNKEKNKNKGKNREEDTEVKI